MNPLYDKVQELKNRIAAGEISGPTALDLFYQHIGVPSAIPESPPVDNEHVAPGAELFSEATIAANAVPEPASEEPADGQTAAADTE